MGDTALSDPSGTSEAVLTIRDVGARGDGLATHEGRTVFVPLTLPGETVRATLSGDRGTLVEVLDPSPDRVTPFCPHYGVCGGCQLQHASESFQHRFKARRIEDALGARGIAATVTRVVGAHGAGRRRATLHARNEGAGYMKLRRHEVADIDQCPILVPALTRTAPAVTRAVHVAIGEADVSLTASDTGLDVAVRAPKGTTASVLMAGLKQFALARLTLNGDLVVQSRPPEIVMGPARVGLPPGSFLQATAGAETALADLVLAGVGKAKRVADLFCGSGPFALRLARRARVLAADSDEGAIAALEAAARHTKGLKPLEVKRRDLFRDPLTRFELEAFDCIVLDPPRAGAEAQVREIGASRARAVVMVSCDAESFARDAAHLVKAGFVLSDLVAVDQFAHSAHVEIFARFSR